MPKSYIRVQFKFSRRYNKDYLIIGKWRTSLFISGADAISALPGLKVASKARPILKPIVDKVTSWAAKGVSKKAVKGVYLQVSEPWKPRPTYMGSLYYWPATRMRYRNITEA
jgi:hypothetical protein